MTAVVLGVLAASVVARVTAFVLAYRSRSHRLALVRQHDLQVRAVLFDAIAITLAVVAIVLALAVEVLR